VGRRGKKSWQTKALSSPALHRIAPDKKDVQAKNKAPERFKKAENRGRLWCKRYGRGRGEKKPPSTKAKPATEVHLFFVG